MSLLSLPMGDVAPHLVAVALCSLRLLPVSFLCPLLGGSSTPTSVRLSLVGALALSLHLAGGIRAPADGSWGLAAAGREVTFGVALGMIAALPFDAARVGGRFIDIFRGSCAEAALPFAGTREAAAGDGLYQLLISLAVTSAGLPVVLGGLWHSFALVPLGGFVATESGALHIARLCGVAIATGLCVGAPVAAAMLAIDAVLALASRCSAPLSLHELGAPLKIVGGAAVLWLSVGLVCERLLAGVVSSSQAMSTLAELGR